MKDYQQKRQKQWLLPEAVYRQALWAVKDLPRMKIRLKELEEELDLLPSSDWEMSRGPEGIVKDPTGDMAEILATLSSRIKAIESATEAVPEAYREGILRKLSLGIPYDERFHYNTWRRWQQAYLYRVAVNLHLY